MTHMSSAISRELGGAPMVDSKLHVRWPVIGEGDRAAVLRVLDRGILSGSFAPEVTALEAEYAAHVGAKHAIATNSGTAALHIALAAAGVGPGDEVITSAYSFVATALAVLHTNAVPVFADIEETSCGVDPELVERAITPRTKAILPVHIHGTPCDIEALSAIARRQISCSSKTRRRRAERASGRATSGRSGSRDASASNRARTSRPARAGWS